MTVDATNFSRSMREEAIKFTSTNRGHRGHRGLTWGETLDAALSFGKTRDREMDFLVSAAQHDVRPSDLMTPPLTQLTR